MANKYNITTIIKLPVHLQYFVRYMFLKGGNSCDGNNYFSRMIASFLEVPPKDYQFIHADKKDEDFEIVLPHLKDKNPLYYNYISPNSNDRILCSVEFVVKATLFTHLDLNCPSDANGNNKGDILYGYRKKHMKSFCALNGLPWWAFDEELWQRLYSRHRAENIDRILEYRQTEANYNRNK